MHDLPVRQVSSYLCVSGLLLCGLMAETVHAADTQFRAGACAVDISPTNLPVLVNGGFFSVTGTQVVDPLHARWLVMTDSTTELAICVVDSCVMPRELADKAKEQVAAATGIPANRILISTTHTHSAPSLMQAHATDCDPAYPDYLVSKMVLGAAEAKRNLVPARAGWIAVNDDRHTYCRRWIRRPDRVIDDPFGQRTVRANMHPGHRNPDVIGPSGPVDPGLTLLALETVEGRPIALLANYSMHYFGAPAVSSDYYGRFSEKIAQRLAAGQATAGLPVVGIMSQGTSGDLQWMNYGKTRPSIDYDQYAEELVEVACQAYGRIAFRNDITLDMVDKDLELAMRVPDVQRLKWAADVMQGFDGFHGGQPTTLPQIYAREQFFINEHPKRLVKLQALRIGDLGIATISAEVFGITGLKLKLQSPFETHMNFALANGEDGYIPPPEQHRLGGYTTWEARTAGLEVDAEPRIVAELLAMLERIAGRPRRAVPLAEGPYVQTILDAQPVSYWQLDEIGGDDATNRIQGNSSAVYRGDRAYYLPGFGDRDVVEATTSRCVHFVGGYVDVQMADIGGDYSVEAWFWNGLPNEVRTVTGTLFQMGEEEHSPRLIISGTSDSVPGRLTWISYRNDRPVALAGSTRIRPKAWNHVILAREGNRTQVFLNGNPEPEIGTTDDSSGRDKPLRRMCVAGGRESGDNLEGRIDELAVYARSLTGDDARQHFRAAGVPVPTPLPVPQSPSTLTSKPRALSYREAVLRSKPLAFWQLYESAADAGDRQQAAVFEDGAGPPTVADQNSFRGGRLRARLEDLGSTWSVEFWFRNSLPNTKRLVTAYLVSRGPDGAEGAPGDHLGVGGTHGATGHLFFFNGNRLNEMVEGITEVPPGTWNHVVLVRDNKTVRVFLNGHPEPECEGEIQVVGESASAELFLGGRNDNFANLQGAVEDVSVYDRALTPQEVSDHFQAMGSGN